MSIFISIACFMDSDILNTIEDCLTKADNPTKITFGICLQCEDTNDHMLIKYNNNPQFKNHIMHWKDAKGSAYARGILYDMFSDEDYFFQIDCHTRFFDNWDTKLLNSHNECKKIKDKCVISHYPININDMNCQSKLNTIVNISTVRCVDAQHGIKTHGRFVSIKDCPKTSWGISAAMLFFDKECYSAVKFDKEIYFGLQFEEQTVLAARYWTHGYDIFTPKDHIIATEYITNRKRESKRPIIDSKLKKQTYDRLCNVMMLNSNDICKQINYIGTVRTLEEYYKMLNIYEKILQVYPNNILDK